MEWGRAETGPGLLGKCVTAYWSPSSTHNPLRHHLLSIVGRRWLGVRKNEEEGEKEGETNCCNSLFSFIVSSLARSPSLFRLWYENARVPNESLFIRSQNYTVAFSQQSSCARARAHARVRVREREEGRNIFLHSFSSLRSRRQDSFYMIFSSIFFLRLSAKSSVFNLHRYAQANFELNIVFRSLNSIYLRALRRRSISFQFFKIIFLLYREFKLAHNQLIIY